MREKSPIHPAINIVDVIAAATENREEKKEFTESQWKRFSVYPEYYILPIFDILNSLSTLLSEQQKILSKYFDDLNIFDDWKIRIDGKLYQIILSGEINPNTLRLVDIDGEISICRVIKRTTGQSFQVFLGDSKTPTSLKTKYISFEIKEL